MSPMEILSWAALTAGVLLVGVAAVGYIRLPDPYSRLNAVTKAAALGLILVLAGAWLAAPGWFAALEVLLAVWLLLTTAPVGGYAIGRAVYRSGASLGPWARYDELREDRDRGR